MNIFHLVDQVLAYGVDGDLVELGCNSVKSSVLISKTMRHIIMRINCTSMIVLKGS